MPRIKLTDRGEMVMETSFDSVEDIKLNYLPEKSREDIIASLNAIGKIAGAEMLDEMMIFFEGMTYQKQKTQRKGGSK